jgi:serine/threonine protein kinase/tetratricopeptide (TPR) repeat protein
MMEAARRCPSCGGELPAGVLQGLCPRCLLRRGIELYLDGEAMGAGSIPDLEPSPLPWRTPAPSLRDAPEPADSRSIAAAVAASAGTFPRILLRETSRDDVTPVSRLASREIPANTIDHGKYQVLGEIARGGMGAILKGRDTDLGRDLAVKVLLESHRDDPELIRRFVEEAQIGGQLQHPGIVPVYDLGCFTDRRPFFTMKLVKGQTLAALLQARPTPAHERPRFLAIFEAVCQTMAYAHARGVIHRDLKPSNVMVGSFGEVQVMDWGLAKVLHAGGVADERRVDPELGAAVRTARSDSDHHASRAGSVLGTPAYMPPEQARGLIHEVNERADVFALGAILCEILTGRPPYSGPSPAELRRQAAGAELADALGRLDTCGADDDLIALGRRCLAPEPAGRPRDAGEVAGALTAHLAGVQGRLRAAELQRAEAQARAAEEHRRRRAERTLAAGLVVVLFVGVAGAGSAAWLFRRTAQTERQLRAAAAQNLAQARQVVEEMYAGVAAELDDLGGMDDYQRDLLRKALRFYEGFALPRSPEEPVRFEAARAGHRVGEIEQKFGRYAEAESACRRAAELAEGLVAERPESSAYRQLLVAILNTLGNIRHRVGQLAAAEEAYRKALEMADGQSADPQDRFRAANAWSGVSRLCRATGRLDEAGVAIRRALEIREGLIREYPDAANYRHFQAADLDNLADIIRQAGRPAEALETFRGALPLRQELVRDLPHVTRFRRELARSYHNIGTMLHEVGRPDEALDSYRLALEVREALVREHPALHDDRNDLAGTYNNRGNLLAEIGRTDEALESYRRAAALREAVVRDHPAVAYYQQGLARAYLNRGGAEARLGRPEDARESFRRAREILERLVREQPGAVAYRELLAESCAGVGEAEGRLGRRDEALEASRKALALWEQLPEAGPRADRVQVERARVYSRCLALLGPGGDAAAEGRRLGDRAVAAVRAAIASGFRDAEALGRDPDFDPIRRRADFRTLLMDLAFPDDPLAR